jgi:hypothetical protein
MEASMRFRQDALDEKPKMLLSSNLYPAPALSALHAVYGLELKEGTLVDTTNGAEPQEIAERIAKNK